MKVVVIGAGGIGSNVVEPAARIMCGAKSPTLVVVDGDVLEEKNLDRQAYGNKDIGRKKAECLAARMSEKFREGAINFAFMDDYISDTNIAEVIEEEDIVLLCVDNHKTRRLVSKHCQKLKTITLISAGNNVEINGKEHSNLGNVQMFLRRKGKSLNDPIEAFHPEIENPSDRHPNDVSCMEVVAERGESATQTIMANLFAATLMVQCMGQVMSKTMAVIPTEITFDTSTMHSNTVLYKQLETK